jgi:hypothetical protein
LAQKTLGAKISALMVEAVGGAQISVNGGDAARDRRKIFYCFFHVLCLFIGEKHDLSKKINRKFCVTTEIGSTFFGCWSVTGQLKK